MESIEGILRRTIYHKPSKFSPAGVPFFIGSLHNGLTVKGEMRKPVVGERYRFYGEMRADKPRPGYEASESFEFATHEVLIDGSDDGVAHYISTHVDGIGKVKAAAIVNHFGSDTLHVLRTTPERVAEVTGVKLELVESITRHFREEITLDPAAYARMVEMFADLRFPKKLVLKLLEDWGSDAPTKVLENPYMLLTYPRMSWETVDSYATTRAKYDPAGIDRHKAAIVEAMARINGEGHTVAGIVDIQGATFELIGCSPAHAAWVACLKENLITEVRGGKKEEDGEEVKDSGPGGELRGERATQGGGKSSLYALPKIHASECEIARRLWLLSESAKPLAHPIDTDGLNEDQVRAVRLLESNGVAILTGLPGVGKSYVLAQFIRSSFESKSFRSIKVVAPTGQASKVFAELLGDLAEQVPCTTIHRALRPTPSDEGEGTPEASARKGRGRDEFMFGHDEFNPMEVDLIICDESSMDDVLLASALLRAIPLGCRVVFVGDPKQLPAVGPGAFLRDMIYAGIPCATLTQIVRSDACGRIVKAIHAIDRGEMPEAAESFNLDIGDNYIHIEENKPVEIANIIVELHAQIKKGSKLGLSPTRDMQVVSAQKAKPFGCHNLNELLSKLLNPPLYADSDDKRPMAFTNEGSEDAETFRPIFRKLDKVIRKKNGLVDGMVEFDEDSSESGRPDWTWSNKTCSNDTWSFQETSVVNGDIGDVVDIVEHTRGVWVVVKFRYPERLCRLSIGECHLELAYASTCHSVQGSGFTYVIVPVHSSFYWDYKKNIGLWCREMLKTEMSRAKMLLATVGERSSMKLAIGRETVDKRRTMLRQRIEEERERREDQRRVQSLRMVEVAEATQEGDAPSLGGPDLSIIDNETTDQTVDSSETVPTVISDRSETIETSERNETKEVERIPPSLLPADPSPPYAREVISNPPDLLLIPSSIPLPWRLVIASRWPADAHEEWGCRVDFLQDAGHSWHEAERLAFEEMTGGPVSQEDCDTYATQKDWEAREDFHVGLLEPWLKDAWATREFDGDVKAYLAEKAERDRKSEHAVKVEKVARREAQKEEAPKLTEIVKGETVNPYKANLIDPVGKGNAKGPKADKAPAKSRARAKQALTSLFDDIEPGA